MSDHTSPILPRSNPSSDELTEFDGDEDFSRAWRDGLTPDPTLSVSEWADQHRMLSPRASAEPGRYRTDRTPYMRAIMDALSPSHATRRVVFMKAAQVGATEAGNNWIGYVIHHAPGPMLAVQPTVELAKRFSRQRIDPLIEESPSLRERVKPARSRDAGNTVLSKEFPAGLLVITGANSAVGLRSLRGGHDWTRKPPLRGSQLRAILHNIEAERPAVSTPSVVVRQIGLGARAYRGRRPARSMCDAAASYHAAPAGRMHDRERPHRYGVAYSLASGLSIHDPQRADRRPRLHSQDYERGSP